MYADLLTSLGISVPLDQIFVENPYFKWNNDILLFVWMQINIETIDFRSIFCSFV